MSDNNEKTVLENKPGIVKRVLGYPFSFVGKSIGSTTKSVKRDISDFKAIKSEIETEKARIANKTTIGMMAENNVHPEKLAVKARSYQNTATIYLGMMVIAGLIMAWLKHDGFNLGILGLTSGLIYIGMFALMFFVMHLSAYRLYKMEDVSFKEFLARSDVQYFKPYPFTTELLKSHFEKFGCSQFFKRKMSEK